MVALFDKNGNGILTKDEFMEGVKGLGLDFQLEKVRALASVLDKKDTGVIEVDDFITQVYQSVPQSIRGDFKMAQAIGILRTIVERLVEQGPNLIKDLIKYEKSIKTEDQNVLRRPKTGIFILEFYKLLKEYNILLNEDDKIVIKDAFLMRINDQYLDIEAIYNNMDTLIKSMTDLSSGSDLELTEIFE